MDPVTHVASGLLLGQAVRHRFSGGRFAVLFAAVAATFPDIDQLSTRFGPEAYLRFHRGITHSLAGGAVEALLLGAVAAFVFRKASLKVAALTAGAAIAIHIFLDCITAYGTQLLLPFSDARFSWPMVFIIDPLLTGSLLFFALLSRQLPSQRKVFALAGLFWMIAWPLTNNGVRSSLEHAYASAYAKAGAPYESVTVLPDALTPFYWKLVAANATDYTVREVSVLGDAGIPPVTVSRVDEALFGRLGREEPFIATARWFSEYPYQVVENDAPCTGRPGERCTRVTFGDVRYLNVSPAMIRLFGPGSPTSTYFQLSADLDASGRLVHYNWRGGGALHRDVPAPDIARADALALPAEGTRSTQ